MGTDLYLKRLEINGFKSFAQHTELVFEKGITAIVGPNGAGKSNVSDAVRWVLGEQSTRMLRGSRREDVIFNGTQRRRPMQFCEVTLTFDNADGALPVDYAEVSVARRLYRSGESEYLLNRTQCRLKDIIELFRDTGIGKEGYSIVGQGRIDDLLSPRSENRRQVFEEAAGIVRYRARKEEAEKKLEGTLQNLQRLGDILGELGAQLGPLEEQSQKAREYIQLSEELKKLELGLFVHQYEAGEQRQKNIEAEKEGVGAHLEDAGRRLQDVEAQMQRTREETAAVDTETARLRQRLMEASERVARLEGDQRVLAERVENLRREDARVRDELSAGEEKAAALRKDLEFRSDDALKQAGAVEEGQRLHAAREEELKALDAALSADRERLEARKTSLMDAMNSLMDVRSKAARLGQIKEGLQARLNEVEQAREAALRERESLDAERKESQAGLELLTHKYKEEKDALERAERAAESARAGVERDAQRLRSAESGLQDRVTRKTMLEDMAREYEGLSYGVRMIMKRAEKDAWLKKGVLGVLGDLVTVPKGLETAMEVALGAAAGHVVTATDQDAKELIGFLREHRFGRATFYPVSSMRERGLSDKERAHLSMPGCLGVASELLRYDAGIRGVVGSLLGRTVVVETLDQAIALARKAGHTFKIVTAAGDVLSPGGAMTGGSRKDSDNGLFARKRALQELVAGISALEAQKKECEEALESGRAALREAEAAVDEKRDALHALQIRIAQARDRHAIVEGCAVDNEKRIVELNEEEARIRESLSDTLAEIEGSGAAEGNIESSQAATRAEIAAMSEALNTRTAQREKLQEEVTAERVRLAALQRESALAETAQKRMQDELAELEKRCAAHRKALEGNASEMERLAALLEEGREKTLADMRAMEDLNAALAETFERRQALAARQDEQEERRSAILAECESLREKKHKLEMQLTKLEFETRALQERIWEDYEVTYATARECRLETGVREAAHRAAEIKASIRLMGPVNVSAVEDYKAARERFDYLTAQQADMLAAKSDLERVIEEFERNMRERFAEQFAIINENFSHTFAELFGGGSARLSLADPGDVLGCDIEIVAQPPGKKLQSISLLSGGEKALTAIAILFAMLKLKPSPFCIFDEIESALDDTNGVRFAKYLRRYSEQTQFIIITHRKDSMAESDILYGITMEEKGVSKMISVRLSA